MGSSAMIWIQAIQGVMSVMGSMQQSQAAQAAADAEIAELERQKEEERLNARSKKSQRAREADRKFASMVAAMADNGGMGTSNYGAFAGSIGYVAGVDLAIIEGNSLSRVAALTSRQRAAKMRADNASNQAFGAMISGVLSAAGGITGTIAKQKERERQTKVAKNTTTTRVPKTSLSVNR